MPGSRKSTLHTGTEHRKGMVSGRKGSRRGKREMKTGSSKRWQVQLIVSGLILVAVVAVKLLAPETVSRYCGQILNLMGENVDFAETFSVVGRTIGENKVTEFLDETCQEVFGTAEIEDADASEEQTEEEAAEAVVYNADTIPENVSLQQEILGFSYQTPLSAGISSGFGYREHPVDGEEKFHYGVDLAGEEGDVIRAFADGTVTAVGKSSDLGNYLMIAHGNDYVTLYAHCRCVTASSGQQVKCGDPVAEVGQTGRATGPHLHFEIHRNTVYLNPEYYLTA